MKNKVSTFVCLDLSPKDDQNRGEDTNISKQILGENWRVWNDKNLLQFF